MSRSGHFHQGAGTVDVFHLTSPENARAIARDGFSASYEDSAHFTSTPEAARSWGAGVVVHFRVPSHELDAHGLGPGPDGGPNEHYYGVASDDDGPGRLDAARVHCVDGPCTRQIPPKH